MRLIETIRNTVETNPAVAVLFNKIGARRSYRDYVIQKAKKRIAYIEERRCYSLMIELSSVCNARCIFCPHAGMKRKKQLMGPEVFETVVRRLQDERICPPVIDLFDVGEPLLDRDLFNKVRRLRLTFPLASLRITSNFAVADDKAIEELLNCGLDSIHISLNAASDSTYRKLMGLNYERTTTNIEKLLQRRTETKSHLNVMLSMVICTENSGERAKFVKRWKRQVDSIRIQRAVDWGGAIDIDPPYAPEMQLYPCNDLFERIVILSNGEIAICCQDHEGSVGANVQERPILGTFHSQVFKEFRAKHLSGVPGSIPLCRNCFAIHSNGANWLFKNFD